MQKIFSRPNIDWVLVAALIPLFLAGLITMKNLANPSAELGAPGGDYFFSRQIIWIGLGFLLFFAFSSLDWRILRNGFLLFSLYLLGVLLLMGMLAVGSPTRGARSWIQFGLFSLEPAEPMKMVLILVLAKYFSRRHVEIRHVKHIIVSGFYAALPALLVFLQPDLGSALVFALIWFGMILSSGISKRHLFLVLLLAAVLFSASWFYVLEPYQKARITSFLNPLSDPRGAGYNVLQSRVAVGSGGLWGRGVGYGTQSRLEFLPEHETDFIFAAFAEEWGFMGVTFLFVLFGVVLWRILKLSKSGQTNLEKFFGVGLIFFILSHFFIHVGMNLGVSPITGISLPFLSYGGSHTVTLMMGLGILMGMRIYGYESGFSRKEEDLTLV